MEGRRRRKAGGWKGEGGGRREGERGGGRGKEEGGIPSKGLGLHGGPAPAMPTPTPPLPTSRPGLQENRLTQERIDATLGAELLGRVVFYGQSDITALLEVRTACGCCQQRPTGGLPAGRCCCCAAVVLLVLRSASSAALPSCSHCGVLSITTAVLPCAVPAGQRPGVQAGAEQAGGSECVGPS